jgi:hypothetical protein
VRPTGPLPVGGINPEASDGSLRAVGGGTRKRSTKSASRRVFLTPHLSSFCKHYSLKRQKRPDTASFGNFYPVITEVLNGVVRFRQTWGTKIVRAEY